MRELSNHMDQIKLSGIRVIGERAAALERQGRQVIKLQVGEPDFSTPGHTVAAAMASLEALDTHYTPNRGILPLREAVAEKLERDNGLRYAPGEEILILNGCAEALFCAVNALIDLGDEVIVIEPAFLSYEQIILLARGVPVVVRAREENGWLPRVEDIRRAVTSKTRMIILNTPNNPTGAVYPRALLEEIAALAVERELLVISDEVYEKLIYGREHVSIASLEGMRDRTVTINGFSKAYAMTGWRLGYTAAPRELTLAMLKVHQYTSTCLPAFVQKGALDAVKNGAQDVECMRLEYQRRRDILLNYFEPCGAVRLVVPDATFYMYLNIGQSGMDSTQFCQRLLEEEGVAIVPDTAFDHAGGKNVRLSFASDEASLREGAEKICRLAQRL